MNLTWKEMVILIVAIIFLLSLIIAIIKHSIRLVAIVVILAFLFSGFTWLPEKIKEWTKSPLTPGQVNEVVDTVKTEFNNYIDEEGQSWIDSANSLWQKLTGEKTENSEG